MRNFGLIGYPLTHSFSKEYFLKKFSKEEIEGCTYQLFPLKSIDDFNSLLESEKDLCGLNVTIPYKELVMNLLDEVDPIAEAVGAVNTILIKMDRERHSLKGFNTDVIGFQQSIKPFLAKEHERALIFGTGGASKAIAYVLSQLQIPFFLVSRSPKKDNEISYNELDAESIARFQLLINCTPLGMHPNLDSMIPIPLEGLGKNHIVYDLVYNPAESKLLREVKSRGGIAINGLNMLKIQAEASWKIWNSQ